MPTKTQFNIRSIVHWKQMGTLLLCALSMAFAQTPEAIKIQSGQQEIEYLHQPGAGAVMFVLPSQPENADAEVKNWIPIAASRKWRLIVPKFPVVADPGVKNLEAAVADVRKRFQAEKAPVYLVGGGVSTAAVFYACTRAPYLWTAALAIGGDPRPAIESDRMFAANTLNTPVAWALTADEKIATADLRLKLTGAGFNLTLLEGPTVGQALDFLAKQAYTAFPQKIDCETGNPTMARCYWIRMTGFDPALRNDAIRSSRLNPEATASLDFGGFGYRADRPGPGVVVEWLPPNYSGPLKVNDRITQLSGRPIADPRHYVEMLGEVKEERPVSVTIERKEGKETERMRITTRYRLRQREEVVTARVQAEHSSEAKEITIVSRAVAALELTIPEGWAPGTVNWNGNQMASPQSPGCLILSLKEPGASRPCPAK